LIHGNSNEVSLMSSISASRHLRFRESPKQPSLSTLSGVGVVEHSAQMGRERVSPGNTPAERPRSEVALMFPPSARPTVEQIGALAAEDGTFIISFDPASAASPPFPTDTDRWVELQANGLAFDVSGLALGPPEPVPEGAHRYGLPPGFDDESLEAITLRPHIASASRMAPVLRRMAGLAAALGGLPNVRAVGWTAARTWSSPAHFRRAVGHWLEGGPFPGLGLTGLARTDNGGLRSDGLALFTGQELRLAPELMQDPRAGARLALRTLHWLVENGRLDIPTQLREPSGGVLALAPTRDRRFVDLSHC